MAYCANLQVMDDMVDNEHSFTFGSFLIWILARRQYPGGNFFFVGFLISSRQNSILVKVQSRAMQI